ncbi:MAG: tyrosine-protein kinase family protein [Burkholderiaceae bacterium]
MSSIEQAARKLQERHFPGAGVRPSTLRQSVSEAPSLADAADLGGASTGGTLVNQHLAQEIAADPETLIPRASDVIDEDLHGSDSRSGPHIISDTDSDLNDEAIGADEADTYTGAVFRNSTDRIRAAHVRALRAKIDRVEASVDEAPVSMPSAPVRAARAVSAGVVGGAIGGAIGGAAADDQPPILSMRNVVRDSALAEDGAGAESAEGADSVREATGADDATMPPSSSEVMREDDASARGEPAAHEDVATDSSQSPGAAPVGSGGKLSLKAIQAQAYLDPNGREDRMREAFEPMADELLEQMASDAAASTPMGRRLMVTSAEHGVGRSLCGMHLALSLAVDHGQSVCYLDLDFTGEPIVPQLGVRTGAGVADWLDGQVQTIDALVVPTEIAGLKLIAAGTAGSVSRRAPRLDRQSMNAFLLAYSARYPEDLVVMGAPPLVDEANAIMLAGLAGQVVVVVEANKTHRKQLAQGLEALQRHSRVSLMLNKVNT